MEKNQETNTGCIHLTVIPKKPFFRIIIFLLFFFFKDDLRAQESVDQLSDSEISERLVYIQRVLEEGQTRANLWWYGWTIGYGSYAAAQFSLALATDDEENKTSRIVAGAKSLLGMSSLLIDPMLPAYAPKLLKEISGSSPEERKKKLIEAERILEKSAERESRGRSWRKYGLVFLVNLTGAIVIWNDHHIQDREERHQKALLSFGTGIIGSSLSTLTQPTRAIEDWDHYKKKYKSPPGQSQINPRPWFIAPYPGGIIAGIYF